MIQQGLFEGTNVELVGGVLVEMSPQGPSHYWLLVELNQRLVRAAGDRYVVAPQGPLAVDDISEPEPDFAVLPKGLDRSAIPQRALLVVEVSVSSLPFDLGIKADRYARAGYPEYWVVDAQHRRVHVHSGPSADGWAHVEVHTSGNLTASAAPAITLDLDTLFD